MMPVDSLKEWDKYSHPELSLPHVIDSVKMTVFLYLVVARLGGFP
jgi:hypothetical protein